MQEKWYLKLIEKLKGKKTYIVALIAAIINLMAAFDVISFQQVEAINYLLAALGLATLRHGIKK